MPSPAGVDRSPVWIHSTPRQMADSFEEAVRKVAYRPVVKTANTTVLAMVHRHQVHADQVSDTGKELWQSLAQATSQKRSPSYTKPPNPGSDKSSPKVVECSGELVPSITASVTKDGSESGDSSCNTSATHGTAIMKQVKSVMELTHETGAGDAKSAVSEVPVALSDGWAGWQTAVPRDSAVKPDDESIGGTVEAGLLDMSEVVSGEESFYSVTSDDHHLVAESGAAAEAADDDHHLVAESGAAAEAADDDGDNVDDVADDAAHVNEAQTEPGTNLSYVALNTY